MLSGGSPKGHSFRQCQSFVSVLPGGWEYEIVDLLSKDIAHCRGCNGCKKGACVIEDDMGAIIDSVVGSDLIVFATPIRFNGPSSIIKTVVDRLQAVWNHPEMLAGKKRWFTFMASAGCEDPGIEGCRTVFRSLCLSLGGEWIEPHIFSGTDSSAEGLESSASSFAESIIPTVSGTHSTSI